MRSVKSPSSVLRTPTKATKVTFHVKEMGERLALM